MPLPRNKWYHNPDALYTEWAKDDYNISKTSRRLDVKRSTLDAELRASGVMSRKPVNNDYIEYTIKGDRGVVAGDWHIPITDWLIVDRMIEDAVRYEATAWIAIPGDFLNQDATSRHLGKQSDASLKWEREAAQRATQRLLEIFDEVYISAGNHDIRHMIRVDSGLGFIDSIQMFINDERVHVTRCDYLFHPSKTGLWRFCHTRQYSRLQLSVPSKIADKYRCNVIAFHRHHSAIGWSTSGYRVVEGAGMFDAQLTQYLKDWSTDYPHWQPGYYIMADGVPYAPMLSPVPNVS